VQITVLTARNDVETLGWLGYAAIAVAAVAITRIKLHPPAVPLLVLVLGLLLLPIRDLYGDSGIASAAVGMTLLFGVGALALAVERRSALWTGLACAGFAAPVLVMRWVAPELLSAGAWGMLQALLAAGPLLLVFVRRSHSGPNETIGPLSLLPALTSAALLALAAYDLVHEDGLSIVWLVLSIAFIAAGMGLKSLALRFAGLILLTIAVLKLFLIDAAALEGLLRILSFFGLGAALIVLGRFYGTLLRGERRDAEQASEPAVPAAAVAG